MKYKRLAISLDSSLRLSNVIFEKNEVITPINKFELSGIINYVWQKWCEFWREYWISSFTGYVDLTGTKVRPNGLLNTRDTNRIIFYIKSLLGRNYKKGPHGSITGSHQELTWGATNIIIDIATELNKLLGTYGNILSLISTYALTIEHLQLTRNAIIHIDSSNINRLKTIVVPHYSITRVRHPIDIIYSYPLGKHIVTYKAWINDLSGFAKNII